MRILLACLLALPLLSGCAAYNRQVFALVNSTGSQLPPDQNDRISGTYKGRPVTTKNLSPICQPDAEGRIEVGDGAVYFAYRPDTIFIGSIGPDGHLHATSGPSVMDGRVADGIMTMTVTTPVCETSYRMRWLS